MERQITHACGHSQTHFLLGFAGEQDRKARWLAKTNCKACFVAGKRATEAAAAAEAGLALARLHLPELCGSERQVTWATRIRTLRLNAMAADLVADGIGECSAWYRVTDAKWWIDNRDLASAELPARAAAAQMVSG